MQTQHRQIELKNGAVAYAPKVVTIWESICEYLRDRGLRAQYVLYSSYAARVEALMAGHINVAWRTPLANLQARRDLAGNA